MVVISGNEEPSSKQRARELGANDFIAKSADAPEVLSRLDNVLRLVRTSKELEQTQAGGGAARRRTTRSPAPIRRTTWSPRAASTSRTRAATAASCR